MLLKNVLIYFDPASKTMVLATCPEAWRPGGLLIVGAAEGVADLLPDFNGSNPGCFANPPPRPDHGHDADTETTVPDDLFAGLQDDREAASRYLSIFIDEAAADARRADRGPAGAGSGRRPGEHQATVRRGAPHQRLGRFIGLNRSPSSRHLMEDLLQTLVDHGRAHAAITERFLAGTDGLRQYVDALGDGRPEEDHFDALAEQFAGRRAAMAVVTRRSCPRPHGPAVSARASGTSGQAAGDDGQTPAPRICGDLRQQIAAAVPASEYDNVLIGQVPFEPPPLVGLKAQLIAEQALESGQHPPLRSAAGRHRSARSRAVQFGVVTDKTPEAVQRLLQVAGVQDATGRALAAARSPACPCPGEPPDPGLKPAETSG